MHNMSKVMCFHLLPSCGTMHFRYYDTNCVFCNICRITLELQKEAKVSKLNHRNIVALFATVCEPGHYGIVMEYVRHGALDDYILSNDVCCSVSLSYKRTYLCIFL